ncbi:MAG: hypothetical protein HQL25_08455 [Candidatus Omnitrophica bacterium]|nr:hypothetical protein [Candidatus Omnitrophota bacterium]
MYLTGGLVKNGWSCNDADIIIFEEEAKPHLAQIRNYFTDLFGWKTDVGQVVMADREPVYLYKIYEGGKWQVPS